MMELDNFHTGPLSASLCGKPPKALLKNITGKSLCCFVCLILIKNKSLECVWGGKSWGGERKARQIKAGMGGEATLLLVQNNEQMSWPHLTSDLITSWLLHTTQRL